MSEIKAKWRQRDQPPFHCLSGALAQPVDLIAVAGGDGTIAEIATRIAGQGIPLAILPLGSANNISKSLGVTGCLEELIDGWVAAKRQRFDVGLARGPWGERRFVEAVGVGLFARLLSVFKAAPGPRS